MINKYYIYIYCTTPGYKGYRYGTHETASLKRCNTLRAAKRKISKWRKQNPEVKFVVQNKYMCFPDIDF